MKAPKYLNRKTVVGGLTFDSAKEADRWNVLRILEQTGQIRNLQRQVRMPLVVNGVKIAAVVVDFAYQHVTPHGDHDVTVYEDTKSPFTRKLPVWRLKSKLFQALHGFPIREV